jgi:tRNA(fMet)-specific endonuclease VapC
MTFLVDTDWVVDSLTGLDLARDLFLQLLPAGAAISIISYIEIMEGIVGERDPERANAVFRAFLREVDVLGINEAVATKTALIRADLRRQGRSINHRAMDLLIAATAVDNGLILVSRNTRHYDDISDLRLYAFS